MKENNLKGLWMPYEILTNENLADKKNMNGNSYRLKETQDWINSNSNI